MRSMKLTYEDVESDDDDDDDDDDDENEERYVKHPFDESQETNLWKFFLIFNLVHFFLCICNFNVFFLFFSCVVPF